MTTQVQVQGLAGARISKRRMFKSKKTSKMYAFDENFFHAFSKVLMVFIPVFFAVCGASFMLNNSVVSEVTTLELKVKSLTAIHQDLKAQEASMLGYDENSMRAKEIGLVPVVKRQVKVYSKKAGRFSYKELG